MLDQQVGAKQTLYVFAICNYENTYILVLSIYLPIYDYHYLSIYNNMLPVCYQLVTPLVQ